MRILYVSPETPDNGGAGIATYIGQATAALSARGHECHVLTWHEEADSPRVKNGPHYRLHQYPNPLFDVGNLAGVDPDLRVSAAVADWIIELHRRFRFDIIEGTDWKAPLYCLLQRRNVEAEIAGCRIVVFNHGLTYAIARHEGTFTPRSTFQRINLEHQCLQLADTVVCPSHAAAQALTDMHSVPRDRIAVVPEPLNYYRERVSEQTPDKTLLYYGSVAVSKGLHDFIRVANRFEAQSPGWYVEFVGPLHGKGRAPRVFAEDIRQLLAVPPEKVSIIGALPRKEALARIGEHHTLINMSKRETFCYAFVEGLFSGARPLALAASAQAEFIPEGVRSEFSVGATATEVDRFDSDALSRSWEQHADEIRDYAQRLTAPSAYCDAYEQLAGNKPCVASIVEGRWTQAPVSVLIPAHEPEHYLLDVIDSVDAQTAGATEIVIGDDGSRSEAANAVLKAAAQRPGVRVVHFPWRGLADTRNRLLQECRTPLFAFVDADDLLQPNFIARSREYLNANFDDGVRCVQGWYELFGTQSGVRGPVIYQHFSHALWNDLKNTVLGVTEVFRDLGYDAELKAGEAEDWEFWLRYFRQGWQVRIIPEVIWRYRRHQHALSARWSEAMSLGTARANARILGSAGAGNIPPHVWEFVGEYMYLGESFFDQHLSGNRYKDLSKIATRVSSFSRAGRPLNFRQRAAVRIMRHLSRSLR